MKERKYIKKFENISIANDDRYVDPIIYKNFIIDSVSESTAIIYDKDHNVIKYIASDYPKGNGVEKAMDYIDKNKN